MIYSIPVIDVFFLLPHKSVPPCMTQNQATFCFIKINGAIDTNWYVVIQTLYLECEL